MIWGIILLRLWFKKAFPWFWPVMTWAPGRLRAWATTSTRPSWGWRARRRTSGSWSASSSTPSRCQFHQHFRAALLCKNVLQSFLLLTVWLCNFLGERILAQKMFVKWGEIDYSTAPWPTPSVLSVSLFCRESGLTIWKHFDLDILRVYTYCWPTSFMHWIVFYTKKVSWRFTTRRPPST